MEDVPRGNPRYQRTPPYELSRKAPRVLSDAEGRAELALTSRGVTKGGFGESLLRRRWEDGLFTAPRLGQTGANPCDASGDARYGFSSPNSGSTALYRRI